LIDADTGVAAELDELARIGADRGGVTRIAWSPELAEANRWLVRRLDAAGCQTELDAAGNVVGRFDGDGQAVVVGSHLDTVPRGGRFDGALGVVAALHAVRSLPDVRRRPVWAVAFNDEEGARFDTSLFGSRAFVGRNLGDLRDRRDAAGTTLAEAMAAASFEFDRLCEARAIDRIGRFLELHIEQGPVLERAGADIGIVTAITGVVLYRVRLVGQANHAGTTPMAFRRDAFAGAARAALVLRDAARARSDLVATVGKITVEPGGANVVPGAATLTVDARSATATGFAVIQDLVRGTFERIAVEEGLEVELEVLSAVEPTDLDAGLRAVLADAAEREGASAVELPSGAGHDTMMLAPHVPAAILFVPSVGGVSHSPDELTSKRHCELGARVLARAVAALAS
jgi:hydantoinase/carbamoylase family amidase